MSLSTLSKNKENYKHKNLNGLLDPEKLKNLLGLNEITKTYKYGELFSGPGGFGYGAQVANVGIEHVWATDYDEDSCETYKKNILIKPESVLIEDITKLKYKKLKDISPVDIISFGFPCNDFSLVGQKKGLTGKFGPLYSYCVKAVKEFNPKAFIAENVAGLSSDSDGDTLRLILKEFKELGYELTVHKYDFSEYAVPQSRKRIVIVGIKASLKKKYKVPDPAMFEALRTTSQEAIENPEISSDCVNHDFRRISPTVIERLKFIAPGKNVFNSEMPEELKLNVKGARMSNIYRRLDPAQPAYTVTGSGGGGTHMYHWKHDRSLTNRERARLQTFPDEFEFKGSFESVRKQVGMAVPPLASQIIFTALVSTLEGNEYSFVEPNIDCD